MMEQMIAPDAIDRTTVTVEIGVGALSFENVVAVARYGAPVRMGDDALAAMSASRSIIEADNPPARPAFTSCAFASRIASLRAVSVSAIKLRA